MSWGMVMWQHKGAKEVHLWESLLMWVGPLDRAAAGFMGQARRTDTGGGIFFMGNGTGRGRGD